MAMTVIKTMEAWRALRRKAHLNHDRGAVIKRTDYGAEIKYADGRVSSLWEYALSEPVMNVALHRARCDGAEFIFVENGLDLA